MKNWTIGKRITLGFAAMLLILVVLSIYIRSHLSITQNGINSVAQASIPSLSLLGNAKEKLNDTRALVLKHVYSTDKKDTDDLESKIQVNIREMSGELEGIQKLATRELAAILEEVKVCRDKNQSVRDQILSSSRSATNAEAAAAVYQLVRNELEPATLAYMQALAKAGEEIEKEAKNSTQAMQSAISSTNLGLLIGCGVSLLLCIALAFTIIRSTNNVLKRISNALDDGSNQVASAASQVSASSQTLAEGSSEQAASLEETSSSLEEMSSMTKRNAENAQKANDLARQARTAADNGAHDMQEMSQAMNEIKSSSDDIGKIIKTIDEIAFQTNILALNAAVEAARAGEAGMGFAVVADEVRNLAQRSALAAKETAGKIEGAIAKASQGVEISTKVATQLEEIVTKVRQVDELVSEVTAASKEQSQGIEQVNTAMGQMDTVTQSAAASAEECASAAEELNAQADSLKGNVNELLQLVGGKMQGLAGTGTAAIKPAKISAPQKRASRQATVPHNGKTRSSDQGPELVADAAKRSAIPLEGDFKNFNS